ncbi:YdeI/OmpD-associated family protein [Arcticibacterium luteifluviistationis]|uniref:Bacteriocin-protection protein n=1 Tax=Arcticibacterium luteifluviistationis TaxID=1784714 RepID=A0A2Z4GCT3_9BACT|nr:YdeI/OmpD-associated family protein [Arcticibacterium luteifluviistationis]AWV98954.1 hypothetical protein DJ013_12545 [Arcticibacterium luteifluviistationis]
MTHKKDDTFYPKSQTEWRAWLEENHVSQPSVWLIFYKKSSPKPSILWSDAVDEALCFGWIDSKKQTIDKDSYRQFFSRRKPNSTWSKINKEKVKTFIANGQMTPAGLKSIAIAKENGSWSILDSVEALIVPDNLEHEFSKHAGAKEYYQSLNKSHKKQVLYWIVAAKREETRMKRISEIAHLAGQNKRPKHII